MDREDRKNRRQKTHSLKKAVRAEQYIFAYLEDKLDEQMEHFLELVLADTGVVRARGKDANRNI
jgi:DNA-binding phage protein